MGGLEDGVWMRSAGEEARKTGGVVPLTGGLLRRLSGALLAILKRVGYKMNICVSLGIRISSTDVIRYFSRSCWKLRLSRVALYFFCVCAVLACT